MKANKLNNIAIVIFGLLAFACSFALVWGGQVQNADYERWQDAPLIQQTGELQSHAPGSDVVLVGSIDPGTSASEEGLAMYEYWQQKTHGSGSNRRQTWEHTYSYDYKPTFALLRDGDQPVTIRSDSALLLNTREVMVGGSVRHNGFAPGDEVTVLGTVRSANAPFEVQANVICGGDSDECLESLAKSVLALYIIAAILILVGGVVVLIGIRKLTGK
jgi:hypothetical protein